MIHTKKLGIFRVGTSLESGVKASAGFSMEPAWKLAQAHAWKLSQALP